MPYKRIGKTVYKIVGNRRIKKGSSKTMAKAKKYLKALYANEPKRRK